MPPNQALQDSNPSPPDAEASDECGFSIDVEAAQPLSPSSTQQHTQTPLGTSLDGRSTQHGPAGLWPRLRARCGVLWRRTKAETRLEWPLAKPRLLVILLCLIFQYIHAVFTTLAYHLHEPLPEPLHDLGFEIFPPLGEDNSAVTEAMVYTGFGMMAVWVVSPFVTRHKSFHSVVVFKRVLVILVTCQVLRIISFLSTQIPAPNYHCLAGEPTSTLDWPEHWWQNIIVNVSRQSSMSCGDLIFSSHTTFLLVFMWAYAVLGQYLLLKILAFMYVAATSCLIIASRKHYTVDITVAWYVVPLVFFHFRRHWTTVRNEIASPDGSQVLPCPVELPGSGALDAKPPRRSRLRGQLHLLWAQLWPKSPGAACSAAAAAAAAAAAGNADTERSSAARTNSARLLAAEQGEGSSSENQAAQEQLQQQQQQQRYGGGSESSEGIVGSNAAPGELSFSASLASLPRGDSSAERGGSGQLAARQGSAAAPTGGSRSASKAGSSGSPVKAAMLEVLEQARSLPHRLGSLRGAGGSSSLQHHRRNESTDSTMALRAGDTSSTYPTPR